MRKLVFVVGFLMIMVTFFTIGLIVVEAKDDESYLRVHIRANSNNEKDQDVKYKVKAAVVDYLTPKIAAGSTFKEVYNLLESNLTNIECVADKVLNENGFTYTSSAKLNEEYFPTRSYNEYTLNNGFYDALIINLGTGKGDNWWCVVYPPLCFIGAEGTGRTDIKYKSKFVEIIQNFFS